ncbi:MAG: hypothetical protein ACR2MT_10845 [Aurantibacter sp.]
MKLKFKNIALFIFLIVILGVPTVLRIIDYRLEAYPSIILPFGAGQVELGDEVKITVNEVYGYSPEGHLKNLDKSQFLQCIRVRYFKFLYEDRFGLKEIENQNFETVRFGIAINRESKVSEEDRMLTKEWLRERLREQGCNDSLLILKKTFVVVKSNGNFHQDTTVVNDAIFELY